MDYSRCEYAGQKVADKMEDETGVYTYPDGSKFVGNLKNGAFHGSGKLFLPRGGWFDGVWEKGRVISGDYVFEDKLKYKENDWEYCDGKNDRRFAKEIQENRLASPSGGVYRNEPLPTGATLKDGCYDAGISYYKSRDDGIYDYETNKFIREATEEEVSPSEERRLERSESKSIIPLSYIIDNLATRRFALRFASLIPDRTP